MKDSYTLDTSWEGLEEQYDAHYDAYYRKAAQVRRLIRRDFHAT